jgi:hypothetical protein
MSDTSKMLLAYYIVYAFTANTGISGVGSTSIFLEQEITSMAQVEIIAQAMKTSLQSVGYVTYTVVITDWKRLPADDKPREGEILQYVPLPVKQG